METWIRQDGRYYHIAITADLFGLVVMVSHGGWCRAAVVRSIPAGSVEAAAAVMAALRKRREAHGYAREIAPDEAQTGCIQAEKLSKTR